MYTIGQVANFLGVTRDTIKYYEEKKLVNPKHDTNGYRKYDQFDIHDIMTTNFYRELNIEVKKIQEIRQSKGVEYVASILEQQEAKLMEELEYKKLLLRQLTSVKEDCKNIPEYLGRFILKEMKPIEVLGEMSDYKAYEEYEMLRNTALRKAVTLNSVRRVIYFDEKGIQKEKYLIVQGMQDTESIDPNKIIFHPKCIYTVIENGRAVKEGKDIDSEVGARLFTMAEENGYELVGVAYINILLTTYENDLERVFVEMYAPIK
ncbi:MerR family transcriptional regulator [Ornithinibacillus scapharcae]|uniref:MerR family transcriptional regulator n=1 Tax=Ornithinibacillus scapharcae TaxID=1147159 RepID=UPI000225AAD2|nr:MerR family transcriptional regulator [Ornithinibacillus scapharcae]